MRKTTIPYIIGCIILLFTATPIMAQPKSEIRAVWLTTLSGLDFPSSPAKTELQVAKQKKECIAILDALAAANFNMIFFQSRIRGDVAYDSKIEPFHAAFAGATGQYPGYDPLAFVIEESHKRGIECHAWVVSINLGSQAQIKRKRGQSIVSRHPEMCIRHNGEWYHNPAHPQTAPYISSIVAEICRNYDIDGIHLDYIRYPEQAHSFPDRADYAKATKGVSLAEFRRNNINKIVYACYDTIKAIKPWVLLSSSPLGRYRDTESYSSWGWNGYHTVYQDAQAWMRAGKHDMVVPMMYASQRLYYPFVIDWIKGANGRHVVPGLAVYFMDKNEKNWSQKQLTDQVLYNRMVGTAGSCYFRYQHLKEDHKHFFSWLKQSAYDYPALIPAARWLDSIAPLEPRNLKVSYMPGEVKLTWRKHPHERDPLPIGYNIYASSKLPISTDNSQCLLASYIRDNEWTVPVTILTGQKLYLTVTAIDRYNNESKPAQFIEIGVPAPYSNGVRK